MQCHRLLGDRGAQPLDLGPGSLQLCSPLFPGRPGRADNTSSAPCLAVRQIVDTVQRSTFHLSAAARWVHRSVSTATNISYVWLGASLQPFTTPSGMRRATLRASPAW